MQHWTKCILGLAWKIVMVGAQCPSGFSCSGIASCYLIYPGSSGLEYQDPNGDYWISDAADVVYPSLNCYKYIPMNVMQSCNDTQRECEKVGGNITVINSIEEYEELTSLLMHIMLTSVDFDIKFKVFNQEVGIGISNGCATFTIKYYVPLAGGNIYMDNIDCSTTHNVDAIICESADVNIAKICPESRIPPPRPPPPPPLPLPPPRPTQPPENDESGVSVRTICIAVSVTVTFILSCFWRVLRTERRTNLGNGTPVVEYQVVAEYVRGNALHTTVAVAQNQDVTDNIECHDTAVDTAAAKEVVYHDTSV